mgnify:CR=1 FL=1
MSVALPRDLSARPRSGMRFLVSAGFAVGLPILLVLGWYLATQG